jgi:mannose-6-phosphate isomerase-like protein (cupin superfamily)
MKTITHRYTGEAITFVETVKDTGGKYLYIEVSLPPFGKGPPLHTHDAFEEEFEVISGTLTVTFNKETLQLNVGDKVLVPKFAKHTFNNTTDVPVTFRVKLTPGVYFEQSARIHYGLMEDGFTKEDGSPANMAHTALILMMQNTLVTSLPKFLQRMLFKSAIKKGMKNGSYDHLQKYIDEPLEDILKTFK